MIEKGEMGLCFRKDGMCVARETGNVESTVWSVWLRPKVEPTQAR